MRKFRDWFAVVVLWVAGVASAMGQQMQPYTSTDGRFTVQFPAGQIKQDTRDVALQGTDKVTVHEFWVEVDNGPAFVIYNVTYGDYPPKYTNGAPQDFLASTRDSVLTGKTLVSDKAIDLNGIPGREFTASDDQQNYYTMRQFLQGSRLYTVFVISAKGTTAALASQFLNSFQIQLVAGVASATGQQTQTIASVVGRFVVDFPAGEIKEATKDIPLQGADKISRHEMSVEVDNGPEFVIYMVTYDDFPPSYTKGAPQDFLVASREPYLKIMTLVSDKAIDLNGIPGREWTASNDHANLTTRQFLQGSRLYTVSVASSKGTTATQASQFLNSFQIQ